MKTTTGTRSVKKRRSPAPRARVISLKPAAKRDFREAGIAGQNRWWELRNRAAIWSGYAALAALLIISCVLWLTSYGKNKAYLQEVSAKVPQVEQQSKALQNPEQRDLFAMLPLLNGLLELPKSADFDVNDPPVSRRMGLYRGNDVSDASQTLYQKRCSKCCYRMSPCVSLTVTQRQRQ